MVDSIFKANYIHTLSLSLFRRQLVYMQIAKNDNLAIRIPIPFLFFLDIESLFYYN